MEPVLCARCGVTLSGGGWQPRPSVALGDGSQVCANEGACERRRAGANPQFALVESKTTGARFTGAAAS